MSKKYQLKPGMHQFVPGSGPGLHHHDSLSDEETEWYLQHYPHISGLLNQKPEDSTIDQDKKSEDHQDVAAEDSPSINLTSSEDHEDLFATD